MSDQDVHGPIDFVIIEFTGDRLGGASADALLDLVESGIVRVFDLLAVRKEEDGSFSGIDIDDSGLTAFSGARSGLLGDEDLKAAADAMEPGTTAAVIVFENTWAIPFIAAARSEGGEVIASARIPAQDVMDALDAIENASV
jgi:Family of unknown function (DUF6325)